MERSIILIVDDEYFPTEYYEKTLNRNLCTKHVIDPDEAIRILESPNHFIAAVILDIMMRPSVRFTAEETDGGIRLGISLFQEIRRIQPDIPIIIVTNVKGAAELKEFQGVSRLHVAVKRDTPPSKLAEIVSSMIENH